MSIFQFTPLREGRLERRYAGVVTVRHFNSRPSARGDADNRRHLHRKHISIHAPPRGATRKKVEELAEIYISIHAPPRGATKRESWGNQRKQISIHAPPRGATRTAVESARRDEISIHAPPRGATSLVCIATEEEVNFNSRPSARGDAMRI